jgi:hypothetical protein
MVHEEEAHGGAGAERSISNIVRMKAKGLDAAVEVASVPEEVFSECACD